MRAINIGALAPRTLNNVRTAARAYLRGNSALVSSYKPIIERAIGRVVLPVWPVLKVKVAAGSTLSFGPGINVLVAYELEIEEGGRIVSRGHLTVNVTLLRKSRGGPIVRPIPRIGRTIFGEGHDRG